MQEPEKAEIPAEEDETGATAKKAAELALAAGTAFMSNDIGLARKLYREAADLLAGIVRLQSDPSKRDFVRLLAIANYYKGGHFLQAKRLADRIKAHRLKDEFKQAVNQFKGALNDRLHKDYRTRVAKHIKMLGKEGKYEDVLLYLNEHPYAFKPEDLCELRFRYANLAGLLSPEDIAAASGLDISSTSLVDDEQPEESQPISACDIITGKKLDTDR